MLVSKLTEHIELEPTSAPPGSSQKIEILRQRAEAGQPLFHPDDNQALTGLVPRIPVYKGSDHQEARRLALEAVEARRAERCS